MGWAFGANSEGKDVGYGVTAICDEPGCSVQIDRGLSYACGGYHEADPGCSGYFCTDHLSYYFRGIEQEMSQQLCRSCGKEWDVDVEIEVEIDVPVNLSDPEGVWFRIIGLRNTTEWVEQPRYFLYTDGHQSEVHPAIAKLLASGAVKAKISKYADEQYQELLAEKMADYEDERHRGTV